MKVRDIIREMNNPMFSTYESHLMVKLTPESFSKDIFHQRADDLISHLESENPPTHVTFLLDGYGYIRDVPHYTFIQYLNEFLGICEEKASSPELSRWKQLFSRSKNTNKNHDLAYSGKPFFSEDIYNQIFLSVHVSQNIRPSQRAIFQEKQKWQIKIMEENQFHLLEEIVNEVSGKGDDETKIHFLKENPEIMFRKFRWMDQRNKPQGKVLNSIFERHFNVRSQLEKLKQEQGTEWSNFLLTQLLDRQKTDKRSHSMSITDASELWKFTFDRIVQGETIEPLTLDLVESILMIDIQTGAPRSGEI